MGFLRIFLVALLPSFFLLSYTKPVAEEVRPVPLMNSSTKRDTIPDSVMTDFRKRIQVFPMGDLNGDGRPDTAILYPPYFKSPSDPVDEGCLGDCVCHIKFSCNLPELKGLVGIGGILANVGDLDNNGICEIAFVPDWFTSAWRNLDVYGYKNNKWQRFGTVSVYVDYMEEDPDYRKYFEKRVIKMDTHKFLLIGDSLNLNPGDKDTSFTVLRPTVFTFP
jgi:hypothetical protein